MFSAHEAVEIEDYLEERKIYISSSQPFASPILPKNAGPTMIRTKTRFSKNYFFFFLHLFYGHF